MQSNAGCTSTGASYRHLLRIAAEIRDVLLHPLQRFPLVFQPVIDASCSEDFGAGKEAPRTDAVIQSYDDDLAR